ncbi:CamS family sex pheromone protein [Caryophanon latum]|uniref:CamS family sex pheromone protein n=1 Tax=Caryophanon latum TaxID=33977 RepID=A0A1C0YP49_9BACL|nr:CamS family sex pheromone protein [Caryophanon latum]OCS88849.1 hypothetical protein A6K76_13605 [Caryophanon latum]
MKKIVPIALASALLLSACAPKQQEEEEVIQNKETVETTIIPSNQLDVTYYKTLVPYKESAARGAVVSNIYTKYDVAESETSLMRLSQNVFDTDNYYFQEGQFISYDAVYEWLAPLSQKEMGLNPAVPEGMDPTTRAKEAPKYLAHIVEQNYLTKTEEGKVALGGISIGLALNSIYYYQKEQYGEYYEEPIPDAKLLEEGKRMANEVVKRLRDMEGVGDVPIMVGLFKQLSRNSIVPGTYMATAVADSGNEQVGEWTTLNEQYVTFPMSSPGDYFRELNTSFRNFKQDIDEYFSNYTSVIGRAFYKDNEAKYLTIEVPVQFFSKAEIIGFTQYLTGVLYSEFPNDLTIEVDIHSINGAEALILKEPDVEEPLVHIYN